MRFCFHIGVFGAGLAFTGLAAGKAETSYHAPREAAVSSRVVPVVRSDPRSGHLVQTIVVAPRVVASHEVKPQQFGKDLDGSLLASISASDSQVKSLIEKAALEHDVSPALVDSLIQVESGYNAYAVSPKGAQGLMQLMPATARRFGVRNTFNVKDNIEGGVKYLKWLKETFKDDRLAIAAYNAGEKAVAKYNNVPPYPETINYVAQVGKRYGKAKRAAEAKRKMETAKVQPPKPEYAPVRQYVDNEGRLHLTTQ